jgi:hypothetical protein
VSYLEEAYSSLVMKVVKIDTLREWAVSSQPPMHTFSKEGLKGLERYLQQKDPQEEILELIAECLSVLSPEAEMETVLSALGALDGMRVRDLFGKLRGLVQLCDLCLESLGLVGHARL